MDCGDLRPLLVDLGRQRLPPAQAEEVERHLVGCPGCRRAREADAALESLLADAVPRPPAPPALRARLAALAAPPAVQRGDGAYRRWAAPALAAGLALAVAGLLVARQLGAAGGAEAQLTAELVNDHLRVLASQRPAEIEGGGPHQVKPWFEGRLDFAPVVPEPGDAELRLRGGAVGYVFDRRAAVLEYTLRLHRLTLLVVRAEGLPFTEGQSVRSATRGYAVHRWRRGELGYAVVADVAEGDLARVAAAFQAATGP